MNKTFNLLFYVKKSKTAADGTAPIYLKVTVDGKPFEISSKRYTIPANWCPMSKKVNGTSEEAKSINSYLMSLEQSVYNAHRDMINNKKVVTAETLKNKLNGIEERERSIVSIFENHNKQMEALLGKEFAQGTLDRYKTSLKHTIDFMKWKYNVSDMDIRLINHAFITEYEFYLRSVRNCNNNSAVKYIKNFGKIIRICLANGWLDKNPFANYKTKVKEVERVYLTEEELQRVIDKQFNTTRLNQIKDIFLFSCYTGLAYADVKKLDKSQIAIGIDGEKWIYTNRQKTDTRSNIPILPVAQTILDKYADDPQCLNKGRLLPILSNQKMNEYLKEIATLCEIEKAFTYHTARHTFATTVTLSNGVPIESVSKMLGHRDLKTTQHYAKILDRKVSEDMKALREKLTPKLVIIPKTTIAN
ncbi:MAG: site-specific integrase [Bacteroidota bacterium]